MIDRRLRAALVAAPLTVLLAACGSSDPVAGGSSTTTSPGASSPGGSSGASSGATGTSGAASTSSGSSASGATGGDDAVELASSMAAAYSRTTSLRFTIDVDAAGQSIKGGGSEKIAGGRVEAVDISEKVPQAGTIRIRIVGDRTWVQLPGVGTAARPWALATASSSNPTLRTLASTLGQVRSQTSVQSYIDFVRAAASTKRVGSETVGGQQATHYAVVVDVSKLASTVPNAGDLKKAGLSTLPVDVWVDQQGRPVLVRSKVTAAGQTVTTDFRAYDYDQPVSITAPPASQVATG